MGGKKEEFFNTGSYQLLSLVFLVGNLAGDQVQSLLANLGDPAATLLRLLGELQLVKGDHNGANQTTGRIAVDLRARATSAAESERDV